MTGAPFSIPRTVWLSCPQRRTDADHWRSEGGRAVSCLCWPEGGYDAAEPCGAHGSPGIKGARCEVRLPGPHMHQCIVDNHVLTWA